MENSRDGCPGVIELEDFSDDSNLHVDDEDIELFVVKPDIGSDVEVNIVNNYSSSSSDYEVDSNYDSDDSRAADVPSKKLRLIAPEWEDARMDLPPEAGSQVGTETKINGIDVNAFPNPSQYKNWIRVYQEEPVNISSKFTVTDPGPKHCPVKHKPINYFLLFVTEKQLALMSEQTNANAKSKLQKKETGVNSKTKSRLEHWHDTNVEEIKKFLAIILNMGLIKRKLINDYWSTDRIECLPWFGETMSLHRFQILLSMLHFTSMKSLPEEHPDYDPWVKVRPFLDSVNHTFKYHYVPFQNLSFIESIVETKNKKCPFIQYMSTSNKPHNECGIRKFELVDSTTMYVVCVDLYSGQDNVELQSGFSQNAVVNLFQQGDYLGKGYHVFTNSFATKVPLAQYLLSQNTYLTGVINKTSKDLSKSMVNTVLEPQQAMFFRKGNVLFVCFKQNLIKKPAHVISTAYHAYNNIIRSRKTGLEGIKPLPIDKYDTITSQVESKFKNFSQWSCARPSGKYWKKLFLNLLDTCMSNAYVLYTQQCKSDRNMNIKKFIMEVIRALASAPKPKPIITITNPTPHPKANVKAAAAPFHRMDKLPNNSRRVCKECTLKKKTSFWCPGCNVGVHKECFHKLEHYWRQPLRKKCKIKVEDSDSD